MLSSFKTYLFDHCLSENERKVLLAVSGGIDSMVMLHLFEQLNELKISVAHCNFNLRGIESDEDEQFVNRYCEQNNIKIFLKSFDTRKFAEQNKVSIQMAARELRYDWFDHLLGEHNIDLVATAHHKSDVVETMLINLTRGTGMAGLHGISARNEKVIRPLLFCSKHEIETYADKHSLMWRNDSSNKKNDYARNKIRNQIIPLLKDINPALEETFITSAKHILDAEQLLNNYLDNIINTIGFKKDEMIYIDLNKLRTLDQYPQFLSVYLSKLKFNHATISDVVRQLNGQSGKRFYSFQYELLIDRNHMIISKLHLRSKICAIAHRGESLVNCDSFDLELKTEENVLGVEKLAKGRETATLDFEKLEFPLKIRPWEPGDTFKPLGMSGHKKVSDFLIDEKINRNDKDLAMVLTSGNKIAWLIGYRIDEDFKVEDKTKKCLELKMKPINKST